MKSFSTLSGMVRLGSPHVVLLALLLSACVSPMPPEEEADVSSSSSSEESDSSQVAIIASAEGVVQAAGIGIYMQGTHRLVADTGEELLLESTAVNLDDYIGVRVSVTGEARPTVEAGGTILLVLTVERLTDDSEPEILMELSSESASSAAASSSKPRASSAAAKSSVAAVAPSSSSESTPDASASSSGISASASVKVMAKAQVDSANFNQQYCSSHIGFCIPFHRNWYFQSFGANVSPYLWHVEFADHAVENPGEGVIVVNLVSGAMADGQAEGVAVEQGDFVVAYRQWTGNRHFQITAPKELRAAVEFMASALVVYQAPEVQ